MFYIFLLQASDSNKYEFYFRWLDSAPDNAAYNVSEDSPRGYVITTLACQTNSSDTGVEFRVFDAGDTITLDSKNFYIVTFTDNGVSKMNLSLRNPLDFETKPSYTLSIVCQVTIKL